MQVAFEIMGYIAVITNFSLIALSPSVKQHSQGYSDMQVCLFFVAAEVSCHRYCSVVKESVAGLMAPIFQKYSFRSSHFLPGIS